VKLLLHPLPVRFFHWTMVASVLSLLLTGLFLSSTPEWLRLPTRIMRQLHGSFGMVLIANLAGQIYYYVYTGKFTEVLLLPRDIATLRSFLRYYLFITEHHPNFGRYNFGQKMIFSAWGFAVAVATVTGWAMLAPNESVLLQRLLGGLVTIRVIHYFVACFFLASIPLHLYLVFTEEPAKLQAMFTGYVQKEPVPIRQEEKS